MSKRDTIIQATKTWLRQVDAKVRNMDGQVQTLVNVKREVKDHSKKIKDLLGNLEESNNARVHEIDRRELNDLRTEKLLKGLDDEGIRKNLFIRQLQEKNLEQEVAMMALETKVETSIAEQVGTTLEEVNKVKFRLEVVEISEIDFKH